MSIAAFLIAAAMSPGAPIDPPSGRRPGTPPSFRARAAIGAQIEAWNKGDLEAAMTVYCRSPDIVWVNRRGVSKGYDDFARTMRLSFPERAAMGTMKMEVENALDLGEDQALVTVRWSIERQGGNGGMGGISTQLWAMCGGALKVVHEHAS